MIKLLLGSCFAPIDPKNKFIFLKSLDRRDNA